MMLYYQTKFGCKWTRSLEDREAIVIFWLYKPSLWPWYWRLLTNFSEWHSGSWCRITIPSLVSKWSAVQKISSGQSFTNILNLRCDLDLDCNNPTFPQDTLTYDAVPSDKVWLQTNQQFRGYWADMIGHTEKISSGQTFADFLNLYCDLDLKCSNPIFP